MMSREQAARGGNPEPGAGFAPPPPGPPVPRWLPSALGRRVGLGKAEVAPQARNKEQEATGSTLQVVGHEGRAMG